MSPVRKRTLSAEVAGASGIVQLADGRLELAIHRYFTLLFIIYTALGQLIETNRYKIQNEN